MGSLLVKWGFLSSSPFTKQQQLHLLPKCGEQNLPFSHLHHTSSYKQFC